MLVGNKREKLGRSEFEMFDEGDAHEREKFWPISKVSEREVCLVPVVVVSVLIQIQEMMMSQRGRDIRTTMLEEGEEEENAKVAEAVRLPRIPRSRHSRTMSSSLTTTVTGWTRAQPLEVYRDRLLEGARLSRDAAEGVPLQKI